MYELVLIVCLLAEPAVCKTQRMPFQEPTTIMDCMWQGQARTVRWLERHPRWQLKRWRCSPVEA